MLIIRLTKKARRGLLNIPNPARNLIESKIKLLAENPQRPDLDIKKLKGKHGDYRMRVGNYRVIYSEDGLILDVSAIGPRGRIYRN